MKTNIIIPIKLYLKDIESIFDYLYQELIKQEKIDVNYYDIIVNDVSTFELSYKTELVCYIDYTIKRKLS